MRYNLTKKLIQLNELGVLKLGILKKMKYKRIIIPITIVVIAIILMIIVQYRNTDIKEETVERFGYDGELFNTEYEYIEPDEYTEMFKEAEDNSVDVIFHEYDSNADIYATMENALSKYIQDMEESGNIVADTSVVTEVTTEDQEEYVDNGPMQYFGTMDSGTDKLKINEDGTETVVTDEDDSTLETEEAVENESVTSKPVASEPVAVVEQPKENKENEKYPLVEADKTYFEDMIISRYINEEGDLVVVSSASYKDGDVAVLNQQDMAQFLVDKANGFNSTDDVIIDDYSAAIDESIYAKNIADCILGILSYTNAEEESAAMEKAVTYFTDSGRHSVSQARKLIERDKALEIKVSMLGKSNKSSSKKDRLYVQITNGEDTINILAKMNSNGKVFDIDVI